MIGYSHLHHPQRAILIWDNDGRGTNREKKKVTFAFVPGLKTDEMIVEFIDKTSKSSKMIKDLPLEGIQLGFNRPE
jgi:hypothetical protein